MGYTEKNYVCACTAGFKGENCEIKGTLIPLLSPLLSGHQALDRLFFVRLALFQECDKGKQSEIVDGRLWTRNAGAVACFFFLFLNKVIFLLKIMLIYDEVI